MENNNTTRDVTMTENTGVDTFNASSIAISVCKQTGLSLTEEQQTAFDGWMAIIRLHQKHVPQVARAIAQIERNRFYVSYEGKTFDSVDAFIHSVFGFERTYIYRMKKYGNWLLDANIPEEREPSETAVREILQKDFTDEERSEIYHDAQANFIERTQKQITQTAQVVQNDTKDTTSSFDSCVGEHMPDRQIYQGTPDSESKYRNVVPEARDIRKAVTKFQKRSNKIYFMQLGKSYSKETPFAAILKDNAPKLTDTTSVLHCFKCYKEATEMKEVDEETAQVLREFIDKLIKLTRKKLEELLTTSVSAEDSCGK